MQCARHHSTATLLTVLSLTAACVYGAVPTPQFGVAHGHYFAPFDLQITVPPGTVVGYTLDGSEPQLTGTLYSEPLHISTTVCVRAAAFTGTDRSPVVTRTYIFPHQVQTQTGAGWPTNWGRVREAAGPNYYTLYGRPFPLTPNTMLPADYEVDPDVAQHPRYTYLFTNDLLSIPTVSLVCDTEDLFSSNGIYFDANTLERGDAWERAASLEFIDPAGALDFDVNCALQIQGGAGRKTWFNPKHNFRISFKSAYGPPMLEQQVFDTTPMDEFDGLVFRAGFNFAWNGTLFGLEPYAQYIRDRFIRDLQCDMGSVCGRSRYVHLYLNGLYWGLYSLTERPDDAFGATYFGGDKEEYDAVDKYGTSAGDRVAWTQMFNIARAGLATSAQYAQIHAYLDVGHFIDYMLVNHWGANYDWPDGNWRCLRRRVPGAGFKYCSWDAEWSVTYFEPYWWNRARYGDLRHELSKIRDTSNDYNTPGTLFWLLYDNAEFRLRYADHVHRHCFNDGVLAVDHVRPAWDPAHPARNRPAARYAALAQRIERAVICESARWGDTWRPIPYQQHAEWQTQRDYILETWLTHRTTNFVQMCRNQNLYPALAAPLFSQHGGHIDAGYGLQVSNVAGAGTVYLTTDGTDPRVPYSGSVASHAIAPGTAPVVLRGSTHVMARTKHGAQWSALTEATFYVTNDYRGICISELMYHPRDGNGIEFIELHNSTTSHVAVSGLRFSEGIHATLPRGLTLAPGGYALLTPDEYAFAQRYPSAARAYHYVGQLGNGGERIELEDPHGVVVDAVTYSDDWYPGTDGAGYSLVRETCTGTGADSWRQSSTIGGSPGMGDPESGAQRIVVSEVLAHAAPPLECAIELHNVTTQAMDLGGWHVSADGIDLTQYAIAPGTIVGPTGYVVLYEYMFSTSQFALSAFGGSVYVSSTTTLHSITYGASACGDSLIRVVNSLGVPWYVPSRTLTFGTNVYAGDPVARSNEFRAGRGAPNSPPRIGPLVVTEVMYHPADDGGEFIEIYNSGSNDVSLHAGEAVNTAWRIADDTDTAYVFPSNTTAAAGGYIVVVGEDVNPYDVRVSYAIPPDVPVLGPCQRKFSNGGDAVRLQRPIASPTGGPPVYVTVDAVHYDDDAPWPVVADGGGPSLERVAATLFGDEPGNWRAGPDGGTPGGVPEPGAAVVGIAMLFYSLRVHRQAHAI